MHPLHASSVIYVHQRKKSIMTKTEEAKMDGGEVKTLGELIEENKERRAEQISAKRKCQLRCHLFLFLSFWFHGSYNRYVIFL